MVRQAEACRCSVPLPHLTSKLMPADAHMPAQPVAAPLRLELRTSFHTAHGADTTRTNVLARLGSGLGEAGLPPYYPHSVEDVCAYLNALEPGPLLADDLTLEDAVDCLPPGPAPARAAADCALHDHWARQLGHPLYRLWGLNPTRAPRTSVTLSLPGDLGAFRERLRARRGWPVLKLKLGSGDVKKDEALVRLAREETEARLGVDANGGWSLGEAARLIPRLAPLNLLFVEQPIADEAPEAWRALRQQLPPGAPPLIADESVQSARDIVRLSGLADGVNVKLAKAGGLRPARQWIAVARALGMKVLLGCMIESRVAVTAAAHLAPLADFADLDGHLNVANDPFDGLEVERGAIRLPERPGLGVVQRERRRS